MKASRRAAAIFMGVLSLYLFGYWLYWHYYRPNLAYAHFLGPKVNEVLDRSVEGMFAPCISLQDAWDARREAQEAKMKLVGTWRGNGMGAEFLEIKEGGEFTMRLGEQTLDGNGGFEQIDGGLYFVAEASCQLEKDDAGNDRLIDEFEFATPHRERCRIGITTFQADSDEEDLLAASVEISVMNGGKPVLRSPCCFVKKKP